MENTVPAPVRRSGTIQSGDVALSYSLIMPQQSKATLVLVHGINDHKGRYVVLQDDLAKADYGSLAYDQRGFGLSEGERADVAHYQELLCDLSGVVHWLRGKHPAAKVFVIGHSLGAAIAATYCIDYANDVDGLILSAPAYDVPLFPFWMEWLAYLLNVFMPARSCRYPSTRGKRSRDPAVDAAVAEDPLIFNRGTPRFYVEFRKMNRYLHERAGQIGLPTLILQGGADTIIRPKGAESLSAQLKHPKNKLIWYEGHYHEVFHEIGRERVVADMITWLEILL